MPEPGNINSAATAISADNTGPYWPGSYDITWTVSNSQNSNLGTSVQVLNVRPLVNLAVDQFVEEDTTVTVTVSLNGTPPSYPVMVDYQVSGSASAGTDHDASSG